MNAFKQIIFISAIFLSLIITSCISDEFTTDPSARLSFSTDTVSFGTVFTDLTTPTARLVVRNPAKKGVNISSIRFVDDNTPFSLNVDGVSGSVFNDVEIRGRDSIFLFIECHIDADQSVEPRKVADRLQFVTNGNIQDVEVEAYAWNVTRLHGVSFHEDTVLSSLRPYVIFDSISVAKGATLTLEPGTILLFHDKARMTVNGTLLALGEAGNMIRMSGDRLDDVLPDVGYEVLAGQWQGITISPESFGNRLEFVNMQSTVSGLTVDSCADLSRNKLTLVNCWLHNSQGNVLKSEFAHIDAYGCCFSEAAGSVVALKGGLHHFSQCTIANAYLFYSFYGPNLLLEHCLPEHADENEEPLMSARFENCIIWGDIGVPLSPGDLTGSDVFIENVLLKADGTDDDNFINCLWNEDPLYYTVRRDYYFNYRVMPESPAIGMGNPAFVTEISLYDMDGIDRLANGDPTLGAYAE